ncbi:MAG: PDZ domain-containing protein, partial [Candidatus Xenobia bacterium]
QMAASKLTAKLVALRLTHVPVHLSTNGVRIVSFLPASRASSRLQQGDVIEQVDETSVQRYQDLRAALHGKRPGETVRMRVERAGTTLEEQVPTIDADGHTMIGIEVENHFDDSALPRRITINTRSIQGGSAGLMFTLEILRQLRGVDLAHGHVVAGTGTIDDVGDVGPVEGVAQKLVAAQRAGATIFMVPEENVCDLPRDTGGVRIIPVRTIHDALAALSRLH